MALSTRRPRGLRYIVTPGYFDAMGMHLREGRDFGWQDLPRASGLSSSIKGGSSPCLARRRPRGRLAQAGGAVTQVIGVISDVHESSVEEVPAGRKFMCRPPRTVRPGAELVVRTKLPPEALASSVYEDVTRR